MQQDQEKKNNSKNTEGVNSSEGTKKIPVWEIDWETKEVTFYWEEVKG